MTALQVGRLGPSLEWKGLAVAGVWGLYAGLWGLGFREQEQPEKSSLQGPRSKITEVSWVWCAGHEGGGHRIKNNSK